MALQNYFANYQGGSEDTSGVPENWAIQQNGVKQSYVQNTVTLLSTDSDGSTYLLAKDLVSTSIITKLELEVDRMVSSGTGYSIGLYDPDTGVALISSCYMNVYDISAGSTKIAPIDGLQFLTHEQTLQTLANFASSGGGVFGINYTKGRYDLVLTANTPGTFASGSGLITARIELVPSG